MSAPRGRSRPLCLADDPVLAACWDSDGVEAALLDERGVIVAVNPAWEAFCLANGGDPARSGVGVSYLAACMAAEPDPMAVLVAAAVRTALSGDLPSPLRLLVPCHSPINERWYDLLISSRFDASGTCRGATVTLSRARPPVAEHISLPGETSPAGRHGFLAGGAAPAPSNGSGGVKPSENGKAGVSGNPHRNGSGPRTDPRGVTGTAADAATTRPADPSTSFPTASAPGSPWPEGTERELLESAPDGLLVADSEGDIRFVNRELERLSGYGRADLLGHEIEVLVASGQQDRHRALRVRFQQTLRHGPMGDGFEIGLNRQDHTVLPVEVVLSAVRIAGRALTLASVRDVSSRRAADHERRRLVQILDLVPDAILVGSGSSLEITYANQAAGELFGYPPDVLVGMQYGDLLPDLGGMDAGSALAAVRAQGANHAVGECELLTSDGRLLPGETHALVVDPDEPPAQPGRGEGARSDDDPGREASEATVVVVVRDISERVASEERLRLSEESFRIAFEKAPVGMAVTLIDEQGHRTVVRANAALGQILAEPVEDLIGASFTDFTAATDERSDAAAARAMRAGGRRDYATRKRYRRRDGSFVWVELRASLVPFPDVPGVTALAHFVDVTERHETERLRAEHAATTGMIARITRNVLAGEALSEIYRQVADGIARVMDVENVTVVVPGPDGHAEVVAAVGPASTALLTGEIPISQAFLERVSRMDRTAVPQPPGEVGTRLQGMLGPGAAAWFGSQPGEGIISVARHRGARVFSSEDVDRLASVVKQLAVAIELGRARAGQERLAVLEDRNRIARDLHDTVIQDLIALGMQLYRTADHEADPVRKASDMQLVEVAEAAVRRLRGAVFELRDDVPGTTVSAALRTLVADAARVLGHHPVISLNGPVDGLTAPVVEHLAAVLREALSNVARHAQASSTSVCVDVSDHTLALTVDDDGRGLPDRVVVGHGLGNVRHRAAVLRGSATVQPREQGGTRVTWTCPLP